jgi:DNA-binding LacI/PurR family transcriptional regulator
MMVGGEGITALLKRSRDFTALVCYNDDIAMQAVRALEVYGLRVPKDISVVGFDDISVPSNFKPALTSIAFDRQSMGRRAVEWISERTEILVNKRASADNEVAQEEKYPVELVVRDSTRRI